LYPLRKEVFRNVVDYNELRMVKLVFEHLLIDYIFLPHLEPKTEDPIQKSHGTPPLFAA